MVIRATSLSDVSLMAMVPDRECKMPTLMGPVALPAGVKGAAVSLATGSFVASVFVSGPLQPNMPRAENAARATDNMCFIVLYSCPIWPLVVVQSESSGSRRHAVGTALPAAVVSTRFDLRGTPL